MSEENKQVEETPKLNLWQKISAVMKDVEYLSKDDKIEFNKTKYKAISEEKVTRTVRESLIKHGLVIFPIEQRHKREGTLSTVDVTYKIVDIDTGESQTLVSSGTGVDTQDKGVGKAMTYAYKYLLLRTFAIPTGEDPDKISSAELDEKMKKQQEQEEESQALTQELVLAFETAMKKVGSAKAVYKAIGTTQEKMAKLFQQGAKKEHQEEALKRLNEIKAESA